MSTEIDERVVEMRFNNSDFERNVQTSLSTLDKLKQKLNFSDAANNLGKLKDATGKFDMNPLGNAVQTVSAKFSALQVIGVTALSNITNQAVNAGKRMLSSLTIDPIKTGFNEYELKMGSMQTIMASTGESIEKVNGYLNELNEYSDKTIYSFADMTNNIGKFTNAGVKLEDAVTAIKGISNEAAVSGANANEASRAMYNFAQALSAGYVKLIDWKSIENANMATVEFKQQLIDTAVKLGTLTKRGDEYVTSSGKAITSTLNFNESLQDQWMTTDVLVDTLKDYADETTDIGKKAYSSAQDIKTVSMMFDTLKESAQSGWAQTWELIIGDLEQAKALLTPLTKTLGDIIDGISDFRNGLISDVMTKSYSDLEKSLVNIVSTDDKVKKSFKDLTKVDIFRLKHLAELNDEQLKNAKCTKDQVKSLKELKTISEKTGVPINEFIDNLDKINGRWLLFDSFKNIGKSIIGIFNALRDAFSNVFGSIDTDSIFNLIESFNKFTAGLIITEETSQKLTNAFSGLLSIIKVILIITGGAFRIAFALATTVCEALGTTVLDVASKIGESITTIVDSLTKGISTEKNFLGGTISDIFTGISGTLSDALSKIKELISDLDLSFITLVGIVIASLFTLSKLGKTLNSFSKSISTLSTILSPVKKIADILSTLNDSLKSLAKAKTTELRSKAFRNIAISIGILAASLALLAYVYNKDPKALLVGGIAIVALGGALVLLMTVISKSKIFKLKNIGVLIGLAGFLVAFSIAIGVISKAAERLASISWPNLGKVGALLGGLLAVVTGIGLIAKYALKSVSKTGLLQMAALFIAMSISIKILTSAIKSLSEMSSADFGTVTSYLAVILAFIGALTLITSKAGKVKGSGMSLLAMVVPIAILVLIIKMIAKMEMIDIGKGLATIAAFIIFFKLFVYNIGSIGKGVFKASASLLAMAASMLILSFIIKIISSMSVTEVATGLGTIALLEVALLVFLKSISKMQPIAIRASKAMLKIALTLMVMSIFIVLLGGILITLSAMKPQNVLAAGLALSMALGMLSVFALAVGKMSAVTPKAFIAVGVFAALGLVVAGLTWLFGKVIKSLGDMKLDNGIKTCEKMSKALLELAKVILVIAAVGALSAIAAVGITAMEGIIVSFGIFAGVIGALVDKFPSIEKAVDKGIPVITKLADGIGQMVGSLIGGITTGLTSGLPDMADDLTDFMTHIQPFLTLISGIKAETLDSANKLVDVISTLASANLKQKIGDFLFGSDSLTGSEQMKNDLIVLGEALNTFAAETKDIKTEDLDKVVDISKKLADISTQLSGSTSWLETWKGLSDMGLWAQNLKDFATGLKDFSDSLSGDNGNLSINTSNMDAAVTAAKGLVELSKEIGDNTSTIETVFGVTDMSNWGRNLKSFGQSLVGYSEAVSQNGAINKEAIDASISAATSLVELAKVINENGGGASLLEAFIGNKDMRSFGEGLESLGSGLQSFSVAVGEPLINVRAIRLATSATNSLSNMFNLMPKDIDKDNIEKFADTLPDLSGALKNYNSEIESLDLTNINNSADSLNTLSKSITKMGEINTSGVSKFKTALSDIANSDMSGFTSKIEEYSSNMSSTGTDMANALKTGLKKGSSSIVAVARSTVSDVAKAFASKNSEITKSGNKMVSALVKGIKSKDKDAKKAGSDISAKAKSGAAKNTYVTAFTEVGEALANGLISGLNNRKNAVINAASSLGSASATAVRQGARVNSPSKLTIPVGESLGEGLIVGIKRITKSVILSGENLGEASAESLSNTIGLLSDVMNMEVNTDPTIKPILDLSNVENGVNRINDLMNIGSSTFSLSSVGNINRMMNSRSQYDQNGSIIKAIDKLGNRIGELGTNNYYVDGITYDDGTNVSNAVSDLVRAIKIGRRV